MMPNPSVESHPNYPAILPDIVGNNSFSNPSNIKNPPSSIDDRVLVEIEYNSMFPDQF